MTLLQRQRFGANNLIEVEFYAVGARSGFNGEQMHRLSQYMGEGMVS